jgi:aminopeptidase N
MSEKPKTHYRRDYRPPDYWIDAVELSFDLHDDRAIVTARLDVRREATLSGDIPPLVLDGEGLELRRIAIDGAELPASRYQVGEESLTIESPPARFTLETEVEIHPEKNTALSGLYRSGSLFCTQCEAHGFRRITYFLDRPDVMSTYTTHIEADRARYPVLLSNGNRIEAQDLPDGRHRVTWRDPFRKPCYLFALVGGDLRCHAGTFTTMSGRDVRLEIWVEPQNVGRTDHALASLQRAMRWDEQRFGREYDLDIYMIVAVHDFNMGAMENKGLNVFNAKYVLADAATATDEEYEAIEAVIAHEYFHNWTGNRVTCRDWFQLTLKEGLTVFRDQQFTADMTSAPVKRIQDLRRLRASQFPEDAGPLAHPIRPESYVSMDNFYTPTVYEKGAEVVRLYQTLLGVDGFRRGMDLYFERHDGQAVTCDDFRAAMADANSADLSRLERWYAQAGTPHLEAKGRYDADARAYELTLTQRYPGAEPGDARRPVPIPVRTSLLGPDGAELPLALQGEKDGSAAQRERLLVLEEAEGRFVFEGVRVPPVPSLLRGFSAPVKLTARRSREELAFLMAHDSDPVNRWDAGQALAMQLLVELQAEVAAGNELALDPRFVAAFGGVLADRSLDGSMQALALTLPGETLIALELSDVDPGAIHTSRRFVVRELARAHRTAFEAIYARCDTGAPYSNARADIDRRRLGNAALRYLAALELPAWTARIARRFEQADNMTDREAAFGLLADVAGPEREQALASFHAAWRHDPLMLDRWFTAQALSSLPDTPARVRALAKHPDFSLANPNRVRALVGAFASGNPVHFHAPDGDGYRFVADVALELDPKNPQLASRIASAFAQWRRYEPVRRARMQAELQRIADTPRLSKDVGENVGRMLNAPAA